MIIADTLSRAPLSSTVTGTELHEESEATISCVVSEICSIQKGGELARATDNDPILKQVIQYTLHGWPEKIPVELKTYWNERGSLSYRDGLLHHGFRIVISEEERESTLAALHDGHQGATKTKARAKSAVWWPSISKSIELYVQNCVTCTRNRHQHPEPLKSTTFPALPWERVAVDLFTYKSQEYLLIVDYFSRFIHVAHLRTTTSVYVIKALMNWFARHGLPQTIASDNGPQFSSSEFAEFAKRIGCTHRTSSPRYAQSNGEAERAVKTVKRLMSSEQSLDEALLSYRSTPLANGYSLSELLYGRRLRTLVPCATTSLIPSWPDLEKVQMRETDMKIKQEERYNTAHRVQPLNPLSHGSKVWVKDLEQDATVVDQVSQRSFMVETDNKRVYRRNSLPTVPLLVL